MRKDNYSYGKRGPVKSGCRIKETEHPTGPNGLQRSQRPGLTMDRKKYRGDNSISEW